MDEAKAMTREEFLALRQKLWSVGPLTRAEQKQLADFALTVLDEQADELATLREENKKLKEKLGELEKENSAFLEVLKHSCAVKISEPPEEI